MHDFIEKGLRIKMTCFQETKSSLTSKLDKMYVSTNAACVVAVVDAAYVMANW